MNENNNEEGKSRFISLRIRVGRLLSRFICVSKCCIKEDNSHIVQQEARSKSSTMPPTPIKKDTEFNLKI